MTWPPTRPVRKRLFGAAFLLVWLAGMYVMWGWRVSVRMGLDYSMTSHWSQRVTYGVGDWLAYHRHETQSMLGGPMHLEDEGFEISPRGITAALIMTAVSSLILYVVWRALVGGFTCAAGTCDGCGYDLRALDGVRCPECGMEFAAC
ncbi:MAG: hypothetical protein IT430_18295 [Phycisphaerales bacterium]|nr:hypothetical protein [Phycisphaerales bacterium]